MAHDGGVEDGNVQRTMVHFAILVSVLFGEPRPVVAQGDEVGLEMGKADYGFTNWVGVVATNYARCVTNWTPDWAALGVTNLVLNRTETEAAGKRAGDYAFHPQGAPWGTVALSVLESESVLAAHNVLIGELAESQIGTLFRLGATNGVSIGDRCYLSPSTNLYAGVLFVRNNVVVEVVAWENGHSVTGIAQNLDEQLKARSTGQ